MVRDLFERHAVIRLLVYAAAIVTALYAISMLWSVIAHYATIILMVFLAWIIVFVLQPIAARLEKLHMPRLLAVALVYVALIALAVGSILLAIPVIRTQATHAAPLLAGLFSPDNTNALGAWVARFLQDLGLSSRDAQELVIQAGRQMQSATGALASQSLALAESMFGQAMSLLFNAMIVIVLSFYMMLDGAALAERIVRRLPPAWIPDVRLFQMHVNTIFGGFLRAALVISLAYAAMNWIVLAALGQPAAVLFALLAGALMVVPWIGGVLAMIPPAALVLLDSPPSVALRNLVILVIALFIAQQITMQIVAPRVMSAHMGMHPLLVFAALLIGAREAGIWGALFGPPVAAVIVAMFDTFFERWQRTSGKYPDLEPSPPSDQVGAAPEAPEGPEEPEAPEGAHTQESKEPELVEAST